MGSEMCIRDSCNASAPACERVRAAAAVGGRARRAFGRIVFEEARLSGRSDAYDKRRSSAGWTMGPNNLFHHLVQHTRRLGYHYLLQLEPDVLPIRPGWLERATCVAAFSDAWIIGSALYANCSYDGRSGRCESELPERFAGHINGNAIYAVGDPAFAKYLKEARYGSLRKLPFDLALHALREQFDQATRRRLMHRFQHSSFVVNMGTLLPDVAALRATLPNAFLVHSSAYAKLDDEQLFSLFGATAATAKAAAAASAQSCGSVGAKGPLDLSPLRRVAGSDRMAAVAFVAGVAYSEMCTNFIESAKRAQVERLLLVALDSPSLRQVHESGLAVIDATHLVSLPEGGSDTFGSAAFFAVNGARYCVLLEMLRAGFNLFILDLDVVLLRDPLAWLANEGAGLLANEMLVQSDARDGQSAEEVDPGLVNVRLGLPKGSGWKYANGGVFFCRATQGTIRVFERVWRRISEASSPPNEQDMLNRELSSARDVAWALLPVNSFPNGFVYFFRPLEGIGAQRPVLVHANWISGVREKVYHLREAGLWALPPPPPPPGAPIPPQLLSIRAEGCEEHSRCDFASQLRALSDALAIANVLNRTLVLPRMPLRRDKPARLAMSISHFIDYSSFSFHFPHHLPRGPSDARRPDVARAHIEVGLGDSPPASHGFVTVGSGKPASMPPGDESLRQWLLPFASASEIHLSAAHRRFGSLSNGREQRELTRHLTRGLKLAARLATVAHEARSVLARMVGVYDCVDASASREYEGLLEVSALSSAETDTLHAAATRLSSRSERVLVVGALPNDANRERARRLPWQAIFVDEYLPRWLVTDYDTVESNATEALAAVEAEVCAHGQRFVGNLAAASTHWICRRRRAMEKRRSKRANGWHACEDALSRSFSPTMNKLLVE